MGGRAKKINVEALDDAQLRELVPTLLQQIAHLQDQVLRFQRMVFGKRSEKTEQIDSSNLLPFAEYADLREEAEANAAEAEVIEVAGHTRKRTKRRKEFPDHLPRKVTECSLTGEELLCPCCGDVRRQIGEVTANELERLEFTYVHVIVRKKYACRSCQGEVVTAPGIDRVLDKCILGPNFLAQIIFERFGNHMPYARLEKKYSAEGLDLSRSVMCTSTMRCAELFEPVYAAHERQVMTAIEHSVLQGDDTVGQLRDGPKKGIRNVHVWAWRDQHGGVFYRMTPTRNRDGPRDVIGDRAGLLQCDGHDSFAGLEPDRVTRIGCWAHVHRYFEAALKRGDALAKQPMKWMQMLFAVEKEAKLGRGSNPLSNEELLELRREKSKPVLDALKSWVDLMKVEQVGLPKGPLMEGVGYVHNQWPTLTRFLENGRIREITNNGCERALRAVVIGRKNWLWYGSEEGARAGLILMSLVQSCRELGINPLLYLRDVLRDISTTPASQVDKLTPRGWKRTVES